MPTKEKQRLQKGVIYMKGRKRKGSRTVRLGEFPSRRFPVLPGCERPQPASMESARFNSGSQKTDTAVTKVQLLSFFLQKKTKQKKTTMLLVRHRGFFFFVRDKKGNCYCRTFKIDNTPPGNRDGVPFHPA